MHHDSTNFLISTIFSDQTEQNALRRLNDSMKRAYYYSLAFEL